MLSFSPLDRDAAYYQISQGSNRWWWDDDSREPRFSTINSWLSSIVQQTNKRAIMWQVPNGNRQYLSENNTVGHYQDNRTEYFLNPTSGRQHIQQWINSGVIGLMWGAGASGQSHYWDSRSDGITNPSPISNGNPMGISTSLTSGYPDDDGGYIRLNVANYYSEGALPLTGGTVTPTPTGPTNTPAPTNTPVPPTATRMPTPTPLSDTIAPTVNIISPANGAQLGKNTTITATASDLSGISSIVLYFDNVVEKTCSNTTRCSTNMNTRRVATGNHTISARATDGSSNHNVGSASISVHK
jgi:hypothetical protein